MKYLFIILVVAISTNTFAMEKETINFLIGKSFRFKDSFKLDRKVDGYGNSFFYTNSLSCVKSNGDLVDTVCYDKITCRIFFTSAAPAEIPAGSTWEITEAEKIWGEYLPDAFTSHATLSTSVGQANGEPGSPHLNHIVCTRHESKRKIKDSDLKRMLLRFGEIID